MVQPVHAARTRCRAGACRMLPGRAKHRSARLGPERCLCDPHPLAPQLVFYGSYHSNPVNQLIHFIFVPAIWWTVAGKPLGGGSPQLASPGRATLAAPHRTACTAAASLGWSCLAAAPCGAVPTVHSPAACRPQLGWPLPHPHHLAPVVWLAYTPPAFSYDLGPLLPKCCAKLAQYLQVSQP